LAVFRVVLARELRASQRSVPDIDGSGHSASNITRDGLRVSSLIVLSNETARRTPPCALAGSVIFEHSRVHLDERRDASFSRPADEKISVLRLICKRL